MPKTLTIRGFALLLVICLLIPVAVGFGATNNNLSLAVNCNGFVSNSGSMTLSRDNTGTGREAFEIRATDGNGNRLLPATTDSFLLGGTVSFGNGTNYSWSTAPTVSPVTLSIISVGGNGLAEEVVYSASGCSSLAATTSSSAAVGANVPRPSSNAAFVQSQPGYAVVNARSLNLRSGSSVRYTVVGIVAGGEFAVVLGQNLDQTWWLLQVGDVRGWANADFLYLRGDLTQVPILDGTGQIQPVTMVTFITQRIYSQPSTLNGFFICNVPAREYEVVGKDQFTAFYQVRAVCEDGRAITGWLPGDVGALRNPARLTLPVTG